MRGRGADLRRGLKWVLTVLTAMLALGCGPWRLTVETSDWFAFGGGGLGVVAWGRPDRWEPNYLDLRMLQWRLEWKQVFAPTAIWPSSRVSGQRMGVRMVELWLPLASSLTASAWLWRSDRQPPPGHCLHCGYDLTNNESGTCPECGHAIAASPT